MKRGAYSGINGKVLKNDMLPFRQTGYYFTCLPEGEHIIFRQCSVLFKNRFHLSAKQFQDRCEEGRMSASGKIPCKIVAVQITL